MLKKRISNLNCRKPGNPCSTPTTDIKQSKDDTYTRSQASKYNRDQCFFCQSDTSETLYPYSSLDRGKKFTDIF